MLTNYDSAKVSVIFNGLPLSGVADGTFVTVEQNEDTFAVTVGSGGDAVRTANNNSSGRVTLTLLQSSESNDALSAVHNADKLSGDGVGALMVKDNSGRTIVTAAKAWIVKPANSEFAREASNREWIFESDNIVHIVGGNIAA